MLQNKLDMLFNLCFVFSLIFQAGALDVDLRGQSILRRMNV